MSENCCPFCGARYDAIVVKTPNDIAKCSMSDADDPEFLNCFCAHFNFRCFIQEEIIEDINDSLKEKLLNLAVEHLVHHPHCAHNGGKKRWYFYYDDLNDAVFSRYPEYVNLADQLKKYPIQTIDVAHRSLLNFSKRYPNYGDAFLPIPMDRRLSFEIHNNRYSCGVAEILVDLGFLKVFDGYGNYTITAAGWQKIDELQKEEQILKQGFIAMSFREETRPIREAFRAAIAQSGYSARVIDEKEHNNQIVPEIFYEIERSKFVVVDVTYPNYGAYYEAGYAQALGKQVIICCRQAEFDGKGNTDRPHFDISQKSMVVWKDEQDLIDRLKKRIEATVKN